MGNKTNRLSALGDLMAEEEAKKKILKGQERVSWALTQILRQNWQEMDDEERRLILEINSLAKELKKETKKAFEKSKN
ncbi:hypothetical protein KBI33_01720 [Candidatus Shapirobacteria bacterium]|nr:hypothetical protein [Candidatus Shapirobacteria bacterium]